MDDFVTYEQVGDAYSILVMMGDGSLEFLDGLATNLLLDLDVGTSRMTAFTTNTGAVIDVCSITRLPTMIVLIGLGHRKDALLHHLTSHRLGRALNIADVTSLNVHFLLHGTDVDASVHALIGERPTDGQGGAITNGSFTILETDHLGPRTVHVIIGGGDEASISKMNHHLTDSECNVGTEHWKEDVRIGAGLPASSMEVDGRHHPFALNLWDHVHLRKGCFVGQEVLARMESRGRTGRMMVRISGESRFGTGDVLYDRGGARVGTITTVGTPQTDVHRGLAIVRMAAAEDTHVLTEDGGSLIVERFER